MTLNTHLDTESNEQNELIIENTFIHFKLDKLHIKYMFK